MAKSWSQNRGETSEKNGGDGVSNREDDYDNQWLEVIKSNRILKEKVEWLEQRVEFLCEEVARGMKEKMFVADDRGGGGEDDDVATRVSEEVDDVRSAFNEEEEGGRNKEDVERDGNGRKSGDLPPVGDSGGQTSDEHFQGFDVLPKSTSRINENGLGYVFCAESSKSKKATNGVQNNHINKNKLNNLFGKNKMFTQIYAKSMMKKRKVLKPCTGSPYAEKLNINCANMEGNNTEDSLSGAVSMGLEPGAEGKRIEKRNEEKIANGLDEANKTVEVGMQVGVVFNSDTRSVIEKLVEMENRMEGQPLQ